MRDQIKNEDYLKKSLLFTIESIQDFEKILPQVIEKQGIDSQGTRNGYNALVMYYTKKMNLLYSLGMPILDIKEDFKKFLEYYSFAWGIEYGYIELVRVLSLGILLNINKNEFKNLQEKISNEKLNDYLVNYLMTSIDSTWEMNSNEFQFKGIYEPIRDIIKEKNKLISFLMFIFY